MLKNAKRHKITLEKIILFQKMSYLCIVKQEQTVLTKITNAHENFSSSQQQGNKHNDSE